MYCIQTDTDQSVQQNRSRSLTGTPSQNGTKFGNSKTTNIGATLSHQSGFRDGSFLRNRPLCLTYCEALVVLFNSGGVTRRPFMSHLANQDVSYRVHDSAKQVSVIQGGPGSKTLFDPNSKIEVFFKTASVWILLTVRRCVCVCWGL